MFFARYFDLVHRAYEEFLEHIGQPLMPELHASDAAFPLVHVEADYRHPLRMGDRIEIDVAVERLGPGSFTLGHTVRRVSSRYPPGSGGAVVARLMTVHASVNVPAKLAIALPSSLAEALSAHLGATQSAP